MTRDATRPGYLRYLGYLGLILLSFFASLMWLPAILAGPVLALGISGSPGKTLGSLLEQLSRIHVAISLVIATLAALGYRDSLSTMALAFATFLIILVTFFSASRRIFGGSKSR